MTEEKRNKEIGRINIEVEKKCNLKLSGDTNIYVSPKLQEEIEGKVGTSYQRLLDEFRKILKKPNFVRVTDKQTNFMYVTILIKDGDFKPYFIHFIKKDGKNFLEDFGFLSMNDLKIYNSIYPFVKIA